MCVCLFVSVGLLRIEPNAVYTKNLPLHASYLTICLSILPVHVEAHLNQIILDSGVKQIIFAKTKIPKVLTHCFSCVHPPCPPYILLFILLLLLFLNHLFPGSQTHSYLKWIEKNVCFRGIFDIFDT